MFSKLITLLFLSFSLFGQENEIAKEKSLKPLNGCSQINRQPTVEFLRFSNQELKNHTDEQIKIFSHFDTNGFMNLVHLIDFPIDEYTFYI